jgi:hypothetical protein
MTEHDASMMAQRRRRRVARVLAVIGLLLVVGAASYFGYSWYNAPPPAPPEDPAAIAEHRAEAEALCTAALSTAKGFGIIPAYTELASDVVGRTNTEARYVCRGRTDAAKYEVTFDLMCKDLNDAKCINLYRVAQDRTGPIYQRR